MPTKQFMIGDTKQFDASLQTQDGVTLIGYTGTDNEDLFMMLMAASEAKHKDGVVHINARQLQLIIQALVEKKFPTDRTIQIQGVRSDTREMNTPESYAKTIEMRSFSIPEWLRNSNPNMCCGTSQ